MKTNPFERNLLDIQQRIARAAAAAGRAVADVKLIAAAKTRSADEVATLNALGVDQVGENYVDEGVAKVINLQHLHCTWHFIGRIQSNKTQLIARHFDWVHTIDRMKIAQRLSRQRLDALQDQAPTDPQDQTRSQTPLQVLLQVNVDADPNKGGCIPEVVPQLAAEVNALPGLQLRGLMTILHPDTDPATGYRNVAQLASDLHGVFDAGHKPVLSMGMSGDLEAAIAAGATHIRIGTALMGARSTP